MPESVRELCDNLPANIRFLASQIARKPSAFTPQWASTVDEAFSLYTRTSTVNLFVSLNDVLLEFNWPFPSYVNLQSEVARQRFGAPSRRLRCLTDLISRGPSLLASVTIPGLIPDKQKARGLFDASMVRLFRWNAESVFKYWQAHPLLVSRRKVLGDLTRCYEKKLWAACVPTALPLLDLVMRAYFGSDKLSVSVQTLRNAFQKSSILPKDLKPGYAVWKGSRDPASGNAFATALREDLRLPGVCLSSFVEFANTYYAWYTAAPAGTSVTLNRHAVMHCASEYWSEINATKLFTFFDLTLRIEKPLRFIIHGSAIPGSHGQGSF